MRAIAWILALMLGLGPAPGGRFAAVAESATPHRLAVHIDQNDPAVMTMTLNNVENVIEHYRELGEEVRVEIVAYGPGLHMLRDDTSPVKDRIERMAREIRPAVVFSACANTMAGMEKREGRPITLVPQASVVPSGVVRLMQLQEQGWSYVRP